jgi:hypothetical protein
MPQNQKSADEIIAAAKNAYKSSGGGQHEFSNAPYSMVKSAAAASAKPVTAPASKPVAPAPTLKQEAHDTGTSIKSNMDNARKALAQ